MIYLILYVLFVILSVINIILWMRKIDDVSVADFLATVFLCLFIVPQVVLFLHQLRGVTLFKKKRSKHGWQS